LLKIAACRYPGKRCTVLLGS